MRPAESGGGSDDGGGIGVVVGGRRRLRPSSLDRLPAAGRDRDGDEDEASAAETAAAAADTSPGRGLPGSRLEPSSFTEAVAIVPESPTEKRSFVSECTYACQQRFRELVLYEPRLTPTRYSSTMVLYSYSTRKRFKDRVDFLPRLRAKSFSETIFTFPKSTFRAFTSTFTHNTPRPLLQYTTGLELSPYITVDSNDGDCNGVATSTTASSTADQPAPTTSEIAISVVA